MRTTASKSGGDGLRRMVSPWTAAVIIACVALLLFGGGYLLLMRSHAGGGANPPDQEQTQAAEKPGDPPSGKVNADDAYSAAEGPGTGSQSAGRR